MMKKLLVALLAAALALCWCGMVTAEVTFDLPLTTDDIPLPEYMDPSVSDLTVEKTGDNEFTFSWKQSPMADAKSFSQYAWFDYETKNGGYEDVFLSEEDLVKTETGWSYTWEAPEDLIKNSLYFSCNWRAIAEDDSLTDYSQTYAYRDGSYVYSKSYTTYAAGEYDSVSDGTGVSVQDGEILSYTKDGLYGNYQYGVLSSYSYWFKNAFGAWQNIEFDAYGKPISSQIWDEDIFSRSYEWREWSGWIYWEDGTEYYLDSDPEGAESPEAVKAPYANPIPEFVPPTTVSDTGFATNLPFTADDLPTIESIEEKDGYWAVTVSGNLDKNDYKTDSSHKAVADVAVDYRSAEGYWISSYFKYEGDHQEGNTYYFAIPEGAELDYPSVRFEVQDGATTYNFTKRDDGAFSVSAYIDDYFSSFANYNSDGELRSVSYRNEETNSWTYWYFYGDDGLLTSYEIEAEDDFYITYLPDGTIDYAYYQTMIDNGNGTFSFDLVYWDAENGWHTETWDDDKGEIVITPADAPEGVKNPTEYEAPYVLAEKVQQHTWYPHNTVCVAGIEFRDAKPELTKKWYNFAAIDLSQEGTQTFDLVASNMYVVGTVTVTRTGDEVVVDWKLRLQGTTDANFDSESEFLTFFSSLDAVTEVEPEWYDGPVYHFGEPISIEKDLGGDTNVLLYIRNTATYCDNLSYKYQRPIYQPRYDENSLGHRMMRDAMQAIMDADTVK